jgi:spore coat polysaccharide biosynthesis predicted glycosyltransferase SpsG
MADILVEADLVLCSGGMTVFEIAALGRPGLVLCQNAKEEARMQRFAREGSILHLGLGTEVGEDVIRERTAALLNDHAARRKMSEAGAKLVEPGGAANAASVIKKAEGRGPANGGRRQ